MFKKILSLACLLLNLNYRSQIDSILFKDKLSDTAVTSNAIPIFSTNGDDAESGLEQQDISSLLQSSRDVFTQFAGSQFGAARYRMRGYSAENQAVMINGVNVNNLETGYSSWSSWGGLNDVTRYTENRFGNVVNRYGFSGPGGYTNIDSKASSFKKGTRVSYANANRIFKNRFMLTYSTGMQKNGLALTFSASSRLGNEVYIPGTYFGASSFYLSIDRRINHKHLLSFTGFVAPIEQGRANAEQKEAYLLAGTNYYNSAWGYQNGKARNANVSKTQRPMLMLNHICDISKNSRLTSSLFYNFGKTSMSGINFNDAPNPRPDYYKYLPNFYYSQHDTSNGDIFAKNWLNDVNTRQIHWDRLIAMNQANLYTDPHVLGQGSNTNETRARYILEDRIENLKNIGINTVYNTRFKKLFLSIGFNGNIYKNRKYKIAEDLLGASFWLDVDQFAEDLGVEESIKQNDIDNPNKKIRTGDKFGYDYSININRAELWSQAEYTLKKIDLYFGVSISDSKVWREGFVANGKFPTSSRGNSEKLNFSNYGIKGGFTYKISGRHFITANGTYLTRAPETNNLFISPRVRNDIISGVTNEEVISGDINYLIKYPDLKLRFTYYNTQINNQVWLRTYWHDSYNTNVDLIMKGVNQNHKGIEFGLEKTIKTSHMLQFTFGYNQSIYTNRPVLEAWQDNNSVAIFKDREVYLKNYRVGGSPQLVSGIGYRYNAKKLWFAGINFNYFDQIYIEPNPDRRTLESAGKFQNNETDAAEQIVAQEKLPHYYTLNINGGKSFRINKKYMLNINLSVNNFLNNKTILTSGFEQLRWDPSNINKFPTKYYYMTGVTYMAMINFNF